MVFGFSVGSIGVGNESYSLHIPFVLSSGSNISIEETLWDSANKLRGSVESSEFNQKEWRETNELVDDPRSLLIPAHHKSLRILANSL